MGTQRERDETRWYSGMNGNLIPVTKHEVRARLLHLAEEITDDHPDRLSQRWLRDHSLSAVPIEGGVPFGICARLRRIWRAYSESTSASLYLVVLDFDPGAPRELYVVSGTMEEFGRTFKEVSRANWLLTPEDGTLLVLNTTGEHYVVAGSMAFVRRTAGCKPATAHRRYGEFAQAWSDERIRRYHLDIAKHYAEFANQGVLSKNPKSSRSRKR